MAASTLYGHAAGAGRNGTGLTPDAAKSQELELQPQDFRSWQHVRSPAEKEQDIVNLCLRDFKDACVARRTVEIEWIMAMAFNAGNQWVAYRRTTNRLETIRDPNDPYRTYHTSNMVTGIIERLTTRSISSQPDVTISAFSQSPQDQGATAEARDIIAHYDDAFDMQTEWRDWCAGALELGLMFRKVGWDKSKPAAIWTQDAYGNMIVRDAPNAGDIDEGSVPGYEIYPDPKGRFDWRRCQYLYHARLYPLGWFQERFGKRGERVQPGTFGSYANSWIQTVIDYIHGDDESYTGSSGAQNQALYMERWELPSRAFPKGRCIPIGGDVLLVDPENLDWPYDKNDEYPFIDLSYGPRRESLWPVGAVTPLIPLQRRLNECMSRWMDTVNNARPVIMVRRGSRLNVGAYQSHRYNEKILWDGAAPPEYTTAPDVHQGLIALVAEIKGQMEDVSGVHEVSNGSVPPGVTAGNAIQLLRDEDNSRIASFSRNIETAAKRVAEWRIALAKQFYDAPRYLAVSRCDDLATADQFARDFSNLTARSGRVRVMVRPGSALPKSPAARNQLILDMAEKGMFLPQALPSTLATLQMMDIDSSDEFRAALEKALQMQLQIAQQSAAAQAQQAMGLQQHVEEMKAAAQLSDQQHDVALKQVDAQSKMGLQQDKAQNDAAMLDAENQYEAWAAQNTRMHPDLTMSFTAKPTPEMVVSAAEMMGLDPGTTAEAKQANAPVPVAAPGGGKPGAAAPSKPTVTTGAKPK